MQLFFVTVSQVVLAVALPYFVVNVFLGARVARRDGGGLRGQEARALRPDAAPDASGYDVYFLIPCLDEETVVAETVAGLLRDRACTVILINDGSDDATESEAARGAATVGAADRLHIVTRTAPDARLGKGAALNAALPVVVEDAHRRGLDPQRVVVGVMDADGRLSAHGTHAPLPLFDDPRVGAVQLTVRIRDRRKLIAQFQDVEFWMISAMSQLARSLTGTVSLGGNGQFTRLSALLDLEGDPWSSSLTEDLDLGLRLVARGWRITTTTAAHVDQQAVDTYGRLLRQRTRWYQGHMQCASRLPELWRSEISQLPLIEVTSYLLVPWIIVLPWSILQQWILLQLVFGSGGGVFATDLGSWPWQLGYAVLWYMLSFLPNLLIGLTYARRTRAVSLRRALLLGHLMILWNYIGYAATWRALFRLVRGKTGWDKTTRTAEPGPDLGVVRAQLRGSRTGLRMPPIVVHAEAA